MTQCEHSYFDLYINNARVDTVILTQRVHSYFDTYFNNARLDTIIFNNTELSRIAGENLIIEEEE